MGKQQEKYFVHFLDIYNVNLRVAVTHRQLDTILEEYNVIEDPRKRDHVPAATTQGFSSKNAYHVFFWIDQQQWIDNWDYDPANLASVCAHEAVHGVGFIWNRIGAGYDDTILRDDEHASYTIGWLTRLLFIQAWKEKPSG